MKSGKKKKYNAKERHKKERKKKSCKGHGSKNGGRQREGGKTPCDTSKGRKRTPGRERKKERGMPTTSIR